MLEEHHWHEFINERERERNRYGKKRDFLQNIDNPFSD